jgi:membrane-bound serine protease (ClpP class)
MIRPLFSLMAVLFAASAHAAEGALPASGIELGLRREGERNPADKPPRDRQPVEAAAESATPAPAPAAQPAFAPRPAGAPSKVVVIPVREQVDSPLLFIVRRGLKAAIEQGADVVVLDMKTPGGAADVTLEIMEALDKFPGRTITYVNDEAGSAGAIIGAITDEIYFAPNGVMGAAELIFGTGQDVGEGLKRKMNSYLGAKIRTFSGDRPLRSDVLEAMMNPDFELKLGDKVIKPKGKLLTLTAREAVATYGNPPEPLLAKGVAANLDDLLTQEIGAGNFEVNRLEVTWSERVAVFLRSLAPILLGLGMLALYLEFKTPGFGAFGISGIACLAVVFLSNYVAGLSGHEPMLVFGLGLVLVALEFFFLPGMLIFAFSGLALMAGSLIWSMADIWPNEPFRLSGEILVAPLRDFGLGVALAVGLALVLARFLPQTSFFTRMAVARPIGGSAQWTGAAPEAGAAVDSLVGRRGVAATDLFPSGQVEIDGRRYEARLEVGFASRGTAVVVRRRTDFGLMVDREKEGAA